MRLDYDTNRHYLMVLCTSGITNASLDLSSLGYATGDGYELRDAQNYFSVIATARGASGPINLPLRLTNVASISGIVTHYANHHTNVKHPGLFNIFVLRRIHSPSPFLNMTVDSSSHAELSGFSTRGSSNLIQASDDLLAPWW